MNIPHFKIAFIAGAIFFIAPTTSSAQTNDFQSQYENFKKQAKAEYEDFRAQCNAEYVEFVKEAWKEYKALPAIPRPKDEIVFPVIRPNKDKGKKIEDMSISCKKNCICPPGAAHKCTERRAIPGSVSFVPSVAGLIIAGEVLKDLAGR